MEIESLEGYCVCHLGNEKKVAKEVLREQRVLLEMTQQQVADKAKISIRQYQKFESGERSILTCSFQMACRIIEALEMNISDFYHGEYAIGAELTADGKHYAKTGRLVDDDIE